MQKKYRKYVAKCVGNRHVEVSRLEDGNLLIELKWKKTTTLCGLVFEAVEETKLRQALNDLGGVK